MGRYMNNVPVNGPKKMRGRIAQDFKCGLLTIAKGSSQTNPYQQVWRNIRKPVTGASQAKRTSYRSRMGAGCGVLSSGCTAIPAAGIQQYYYQRRQLGRGNRKLQGHELLESHDEVGFEGTGIAQQANCSRGIFSPLRLPSTVTAIASVRKKAWASAIKSSAVTPSMRWMSSSRSVN